MITILTGDKVNSGDFIIVDRGIKLLKKFYPNEELLKLDRWKPIEGHIEKINRSRFLILLGGPAVVHNLYPGTYPLVTNLNLINVPIIAMGLGSKLKPYNSNAEKYFKFSKSSYNLLDRLSHDYKYFSVRDYITHRLLMQNNVSNSIVTGCPAWFNLETLGNPIVVNNIKTIAFAPGTGHFFSKKIFNQKIEIIKMLAHKFPDSKKLCVFQEGLENDKYFSTDMIKVQKRLSIESQKSGYEEINCTNNLDNMQSAYSKVDFLISYRVHSHICMLSLGKPSILIAEDSRGHGANNLIGLRNFNSYIEDRKIFNKYYYLNRLNGKILRKIYPPKANPFLVKNITNYIDELIENNFFEFSCVHKLIMKYFKRMEKFIKNLPS